VTVMLAPGLRCVEAERVVVPGLPQHVNEGSANASDPRSVGKFLAGEVSSHDVRWAGLDVRLRASAGRVWLSETRGRGLESELELVGVGIGDK
jgi:hypothetical protein